jgi:Fungal protein kinase
MVDSRQEKLWVIPNDFDLASKVTNTNSSAQHRTGTLPFMSLELLKQADAKHCLRHDLESLFYVAIWWVAKELIIREIPL